MTASQQKTSLFYDSNCKWGSLLKQNLYISRLSLFQYRSLFLANCRKNIWQIFPPAPKNIGRLFYPGFDDFQNKWYCSILDPDQTGKGDQIQFIVQKKFKNTNKKTCFQYRQFLIFPTGNEQWYWEAPKHQKEPVQSGDGERVFGR